MNCVTFALLLAICLVVSGQDPKILDAVDASKAAGADEEPKGDAKPPNQSGGGQVAAATSRHFGFGSFPTFKPRPYIGTCPEYKYYIPDPKCPEGGYCKSNRCRFTVRIGYYCGLPFYLYKPVYIGGSSCKNEDGKCGSSHWAKCSCKTTWCWLNLKRVIKHNGKFYVVVVYIRRPCGCDCHEKHVDYHYNNILDPIDSHDTIFPFPF